MKEKNRLIRNKAEIEIENAEMGTIKWPQYFHNKSYVTNCYWLVKNVNVEPKLELVATYHIIFIVKILWM